MTTFLVPPAPFWWRREIERHAARLSGMPGSGRSDLAVRPCAFCPPPIITPIKRPCVLCRAERKRDRESPLGFEVNGEPACVEHFLAVQRLRAQMADVAAWNAKLEREATANAHAEAVAAAQYHLRRLQREIAQ